MQSSAGPRHLGDLPANSTEQPPRPPDLCSLPTSENGPKYVAFVALSGARGAEHARGGS